MISKECLDPVVIVVRQKEHRVLLDDYAMTDRVERLREIKSVDYNKGISIE